MKTGYIGTYKGIECYGYSKKDYLKLVEQNSVNPKNIYIIVDNGDMVKDGMCIGYYDGNQVEDKRPTRYKVEERRVETVAQEELSILELNFDEYMKEVNEFFKKLGIEVC